MDKEKMVCRQQRGIHSRKSAFVPAPEGTLFLWDVANLIGEAGPDQAANLLDSISASLLAQGYQSMFFIERRALNWTKYNQSSLEDFAALEAFVRRDDFTVVARGGNAYENDEADCAILQVAEAIPNSMCVSNDRFSDYANAHPGIVGSSRVCSFSVSRIGGLRIVAVNGLRRAIVVEPQLYESTRGALEESISNVHEYYAGEIRDDADHTGLFSVADNYLQRGDAQNAERLYAKVARKDPAGYDALAEMYCGGKTVRADVRKVMRYERLSRESTKGLRERILRDRRLRARTLRFGERDLTHFSVKRRKALRIAAFNDVHETIKGYYKGSKSESSVSLGRMA